MIRGCCMSNLLCFSIDRWYWGKVNQGLIVETGETNEISCLMIADWYDTHFVWLSYFILLLFCTQSGEGSWFLGTFENVLENIWPTSVNIEELKCEWWNGVLCGIDVHCNGIWHNWLGESVWAICCVFQLTGDIEEKIIEGWLQRLVTLMRF